MNKQEFLSALAGALSGAPQEDINERIAFYGEMIDERMDEGIAEEDAISEIGAVEEIAAQIRADIPHAESVKDAPKAGRPLGTWGIVLLVLGSPIWLSLLVSVFAVVLSLYITLWSAIISLWAVEVSLWCAALCGVANGAVKMAFGEVYAGFSLMGVGIACAGLSVFLFFGCMAAARGALQLAEKIISGIKRCFGKKG